MPPDHRPVSRRRNPVRFLPSDPEERQAEIAKEEAAIRRQVGTWGLDLQDPAGDGAAIGNPSPKRS